MTQRHNPNQNNSNTPWQRSLPAQSLCWLSSVSFLSSGFVVAQTSSVDNIVPTVTAPTGQKVKKDIVISVSKGSTPQSASQSEFARRRQKLKQRLTQVKSPPKTSQPPKPTQSKVKVAGQNNRTRRLRARLKSPKAPVVVRTKKPKTSVSQQQVIIKTNNRVKPTPAKKAPTLASPIKTKSTTATTKRPDYNNSLIDPTKYTATRKPQYKAPTAVVMTQKGSGCQALLGKGQAISGKLCGTPASKPKVANAKKATPNWLKKSQNAQVAKATTTRTRATVSPSKIPQPKTSTASRVTPSSPKVTRRVTSAIAPKATNQVTKTVRRVTRVASGERNKRVRPNRFIPAPSSFVPKTTVSATPLTPNGGNLPAPLTANNTAPRPSVVAYNIPLASVLPKISIQGTYARNPNGMVFPLSVPTAISSVFGWRQHPITGDRRFHSGTDLAGAMGTPVLAAVSGSVEIADWVGGYGLTVVLNHNNARQTLYGHMSELLVNPGQWVEQGTVIGRVGSTGLSTGPHLHFEVRQLTANGWVATDPGVHLQPALNQLTQSLQTAQVSSGE